MGLLFSFVLIFGILLLLLLGLSVGVAFLLSWLLPGVGMEMALLIAVLAVGQAMFLFGRLVGSLPNPLDEPDGEPHPIVILDPETAFRRRPRRRT